MRAYNVDEIDYWFQIYQLFYIRIFRTNVVFLVTFLLCWKIHTKKRADITLMKLTTGVKFINFFTQAFFVQKSLAQLFSNYSLALYFFAKRILVQMLPIKSWWNWLQVSISSTFYTQLLCINFCAKKNSEPKHN